MIKTTIDKLKYSETRILAEYFGSMTLTSGGMKIFKPGEKAHDTAHTHNVNEVLIFIQGKGQVPIDGKIHPLKTGDVVIIEPGEDHRTESSVDDPLACAWFLMER
ncbi:MAG TPA: cupin domain-containing protein [Anaerolineales bacterium]|nr:cupin domain-containing protein [Anaerolineales bacterium]